MADNQSGRALYNQALGALEESHADGEISDRDYELIRDFLDAYDEESFTVSKPADESHLSERTLKSYCTTLRLVAERIDGSLYGRRVDDDVDSLATADATALNGHIQSVMTGEHPAAPDDGYSEASVKTRQTSLRSFLKYHDDHEADAEDIEIISNIDTQVTEQDVLTRDEIHDLIDATQSARDRAILSLLAFTGQRVEAIRTLRVKDVFIGEDGRHFQLNPEADGLKGAEGKRPLLGARKPLEDYHEREHPCPDDPEAAAITVQKRGPGGGGERASYQTIHYAVNKAAKAADGIDPDRIHPHIFRHSFVTHCVREHDLSDSSIKRLIGHSPESRVMETTYSHLTDEDAIEEIEVAEGLADPDEEKALTPPTCNVCREPLRPDAKACSNCGEVYHPDARAVLDEARETTAEVTREAAFAADDPEEQAAVEAVSDHIRQQLQENPDEAIDALREAGLLGSREDD